MVSKPSKESARSETFNIPQGSGHQQQGLLFTGALRRTGRSINCHQSDVENRRRLSTIRRQTLEITKSRVIDRQPLYGIRVVEIAQLLLSVCYNFFYSDGASVAPVALYLVKNSEAGGAFLERAVPSKRQTRLRKRTHGDLLPSPWGPTRNKPVTKT